MGVNWNLVIIFDFLQMYNTFFFSKPVKVTPWTSFEGICHICHKVRVLLGSTRHDRATHLQNQVAPWGYLFRKICHALGGGQRIWENLAIHLCYPSDFHNVQTTIHTHPAVHWMSRFRCMTHGICRSAPQSKNAVCALQINPKLLPFPLERNPAEHTTS